MGVSLKTYRWFPVKGRERWRGAVTHLGIRDRGGQSTQISSSPISHSWTAVQAEAGHCPSHRASPRGLPSTITQPLLEGPRRQQPPKTAAQHCAEVRWPCQLLTEKPGGHFLTHMGKAGAHAEGEKPWMENTALLGSLPWGGGRASRRRNEAGFAIAQTARCRWCSKRQVQSSWSDKDLNCQASGGGTDGCFPVAVICSSPFL